jgi:hypothetical protein
MRTNVVSRRYISVKAEKATGIRGFYEGKP